MISWWQIGTDVQVANIAQGKGEMGVVDDENLDGLLDREERF